MYDNQNKIDKIERQVKQMNPSIRIASFGLNENQVVSVGLRIPIKGNSSTIKKLEEQGWRKIRKEKVRTDNGRYIRNQYNGFIFVQCMELSI